ncbi:MAG: HAMP domain-containing histidine kinase [Bacteroidales bacterium]|jgi:signal transduction histidine kinase|nr:HAMP domain-containing histidine kinase [Bacteroidales bacterium]
MAKCHQPIVSGLAVVLLMVLHDPIAAYPAANNTRPVSDNEIKADSIVRQASQRNDSIRLFFNRGNYIQARRLAEQNIQAAGDAHIWDVVLQNYETLIVIDSMTRNFSAAFEHLKAKEKAAQKWYAAQKDEIINDRAKRQSLEGMNQQIAGMEEELETTETGARSRMKRITALSVIVLVLMMAVIVEIYRYERHKRANGSLLNENEQGRQQSDELTRLVNEYYDENQQLTRDNDRLEKSNAVKDKLLSIISHDLRSPMSSLQALLGLFNTNNIARAYLVDFFGKLLSRVENTSTMLENLLHWSQYQLKGLEPIFDNVDLQKIIDECINLYRMQVEQKHIVIDNSLKTTVHVCADVEMLKVILRNLISNALKFTHPGGIITIKAMTKENHAIISVKDTGVGISPENQAKMFAVANFTTPGTEKEKGTGLGLMLCKDFVEHNHGKIWLDSKVNVGTTFYFSIPLAGEQFP